MSYHSFFSFAAGLEKTLHIPKGTIEQIIDCIAETENALKITREKYLDNPEHWAHNDYKTIQNKILCSTASIHNRIVRNFYNDLAIWAENPPSEFEELTNEIFQTILPGLNEIKVKPERWTGDYYTEQMEHLYEVMRGREDDGVSFDTKKLTEKQAAAVINLFSEYLDKDDRRLDVPKGHDCLASSYDGGYEWCEKCGAITFEDARRCNTRKCPLIAEYKANGEID